MINVVVMSLLDDSHLEDDLLYDQEADLQEIAARYHQRVGFTYYDHILSGMQLEEMMGKSWESLMSSNSNAFSELLFFAGESFDGLIDDPMMQAMALDDLEYVVENLEVLMTRYRDRYVWQHAKMYFRELDAAHDEAYIADFQALKQRLMDLFGEAFYSYRVKDRAGQLRIDRHLSEQICDHFADDVEAVCGAYTHQQERDMDEAVNLEQLARAMSVSLSADDRQALHTKPLSRYTIYQYIALKLSRLGYAMADVSDRVEDGGYMLLKAAARKEHESLMTALSLIASTRQGLRYEDLTALLKKKGQTFQPEMMSAFVKRYFELFSYHGEALDLMFNIKSAFREDYAQEILDYFYTLDRHDEIRRSELAYYIITCHDYKKMIETILEAQQYDDRDALDTISESLYLQSVKDHGDWLTQMIKAAMGLEDQAREDILSFMFDAFEHDYKRLLASSRQQGTTLLPLTEALYDLAITIKAHDHASWVLLSWAYDFLGDTCHFFGAAYDLSVLCYKEAVKNKQEMMAAEGRREDILSSLSLTYRDLSESYRQLGDEAKAQAYATLSQESAS